MPTNHITRKLSSALEILIEEKKSKSGLPETKQANAMGIPQQTFNKYVKNEVEAPISAIYKMSEYYNVSCDYLLGLSKNPSTDPERRAITKKYGLSNESLQALEYAAMSIKKRRIKDVELLKKISDDNKKGFESLTEKQRKNLIPDKDLFENTPKYELVIPPTTPKEKDIAEKNNHRNQKIKLMIINDLVSHQTVVHYSSFLWRSLINAYIAGLDDIYDNVEVTLYANDDDKENYTTLINLFNVEMDSFKDCFKEMLKSKKQNDGE
jgi:plasmid maintenance system antidote protein VapI